MKTELAIMLFILLIGYSCTAITHVKDIQPSGQVAKPKHRCPKCGGLTLFHAKTNVYECETCQ